MKNPLLALVSVCLLTFASCRDDRNPLEDQNSNSSASSPETLSSGSQTRSNRTEASAKPFLDPLSELENKLSSGKTFDLVALGKQVRELMEQYPDEALALLEKYGTWLYEQDPADSIQFIISNSYFVEGSKGSDFASELLNDWKTSDQPAFESHLHKLSEHGTGSEHYCHRVLQLLMQGEGEELTPEKWLQWVNELSKGPDNKGALQGEALNALLSLVDANDSTHFEALSKAYQQRLADPGLQKHIPVFADTLAKHHPEKTTQLLADMPGGLYREESLTRIITELGYSHPEVAAEWLSSQDILKKIYRPEFDTWRETATDKGMTKEQITEGELAFQEHIDSVFDRTLQTYILSVVHRHPEDALATVDSIIDPEHREKLLKQIQSIVNTQEPALTE